MLQEKWRNTEYGTIKKDIGNYARPRGHQSVPESLNASPVKIPQCLTDNTDRAKQGPHHHYCTKRPRPPSAHQPQPWPTAKTPTNARHKSDGVKSPYPQTMARASPHTAAPKSKDHPCPQEALEALNQPPPKPNRPRSPPQKLARTTRTNPKPPMTSPAHVAKRAVSRLFKFVVVNLNLPWWIWICRGEF